MKKELLKSHNAIVPKPDWSIDLRLLFHRSINFQPVSSAVKLRHKFLLFLEYHIFLA